MGRTHPMMHSKLHPCLELLHPFTYHRQQYPTTPNFFGLTNVESCCAVCIIGNVFCCVIKLDIHKAATLGLSASVCLMEVARSIEVCHKLTYSCRNVTILPNKTRHERSQWSTIGRQLLSRTVPLHHAFEMKLN